MQCNKDQSFLLDSPDLQVHDDLPLVHILRVHLDPVDPEGLRHKHTEMQWAARQRRPDGPPGAEHELDPPPDPARKLFTQQAHTSEAGRVRFVARCRPPAPPHPTPPAVPPAASAATCWDLFVCISQRCSDTEAAGRRSLSVRCRSCWSRRCWGASCSPLSPAPPSRGGPSPQTGRCRATSASPSEGGENTGRDVAQRRTLGLNESTYRAPPCLLINQKPTCTLVLWIMFKTRLPFEPLVLNNKSSCQRLSASRVYSRPTCIMKNQAMGSLTPVHSLPLQGWDCMLSVMRWCSRSTISGAAAPGREGRPTSSPVYEKGRRWRSGVEGRHSSRQIEETGARWVTLFNHSTRSMSGKWT